MMFIPKCHPIVWRGGFFFVLCCLTGRNVESQNSTALSADGAWAAYDLRDTLWVVSTNGGMPRMVSKSTSYTTVPCWSPTGGKLAYFSVESGTSQLWLYDVASGKRTQTSRVEGGINPNPYGRFSGYIGDPLIYSWSPDGKTIVFAHQVPVQGTETRNIVQRPPPAESLAAGHPLVLTLKTPPEWTLQGLTISHSGATFKNGRFTKADDSTFRPRLFTQLWVLDVASGKAQQITQDTAQYFTPQWSPDGKRLLYMTTEGRSLAGFGPEESNLYVRDMSTGHAQKITSGRMQKTLPRWSPDGQRVAYLASAGFSRAGGGVYVVAADGSGSARNVTARLDRHIPSYGWSPDGRSIIISYRDGIWNPAARVDVATGVVTPLSPHDAVANDLSTSPGGGVWSQSTDPNGPLSLFVQTSTATQPRAVAQLRPPAGRDARRQEALSWKNRRGDTIEGIVIYPRGYVKGTRYPIVVDAYGSGTNTRWDRGSLYEVTPNYVVFRPNHRAPHMWPNPVKSAQYDSAATGPNGIAVMVDDILSGVDMLVKRGVIDPKRMCVFGFSNGGLEGEQLLEHTDRFKCAVLQSPSTSDWLLAFFMATDDPEVIRWMGGTAPWDDPAKYTSLIPLYSAPKINAAVMLAVGDLEGSTTLATVEMYNALRFLRKNVTLLRYSAQGHGFTGEAEKDFQARMRGFFDKYLGAGQ